METQESSPQEPSKEAILSEYELLGRAYGSGEPQETQVQEPEIELPETISTEGFEPNGLFVWLINKYNAETDPEVRQKLYTQIYEKPESVSASLPEEVNPQLPDKIENPGYPENSIMKFLIDNYNEETDDNKRQILLDKIYIQYDREPIPGRKLTGRPLDADSVGDQPESGRPLDADSLGDQPEVVSGAVPEEIRQMRLGEPKTEEEPVIIPSKAIEAPPDPDIKPPKSQAHVEKTEQRRFALLSQASYDTYYTSAEKANDKLQVYMPAHHILPEYSDKNSTVIEKINNNGEQELIISYRGTDPFNPLDLTADAQIAFGNPSAQLLNFPVGRFREAENKYLELKKQFPNAKITLTGHSLGARQALLIGEKYNVPTRAFNVGSSIADYVISNYPKRDDIKIYTVDSDWISSPNRKDTSQEVISVVPMQETTLLAPLAGHGLDNFIPNWIRSGRPNRTEKDIKVSFPEPEIKVSFPEEFRMSFNPLISYESLGLTTSFSDYGIISKFEELKEPKWKPIEKETDSTRKCYFDYTKNRRICPDKPTKPIKPNFIRPRARNFY